MRKSELNMKKRKKKKTEKIERESESESEREIVAWKKSKNVFKSMRIVYYYGNCLPQTKTINSDDDDGDDDDWGDGRTGITSVVVMCLLSITYYIVRKRMHAMHECVCALNIFDKIAVLIAKRNLTS